MTAHQEGMRERFCSVLIVLSVFAAIISVAYWLGISLGDYSPQRALKTCLYLTLVLGFVQVTSPYLRKKLTWPDLFKYGILLTVALFAQGTYQTMESNLLLGILFPLLGFVIAFIVVCGGAWFYLRLPH